MHFHPFNFQECAIKMDAGSQSAETVQLLAVKVLCKSCLNKQEFSVQRIKVYFVIFSTTLSINSFVQMVLVQP